MVDMETKSVNGTAEMEKNRTNWEKNWFKALKISEIHGLRHLKFLKYIEIEEILGSGRSGCSKKHREWDGENMSIAGLDVVGDGIADIEKRTELGDPHQLTFNNTV